MDRRRWIELTSISGKDIRSSFRLPNPFLFISVNGRYKHTAPPTRTGLRIPVGKNHAGLSPVWKGPVWIDLENEPDIVLEFDLMAQVNRQDEPDLYDAEERDTHYGEVNVPINHLLAEGPPGSLCHVSYQVRAPDGSPNGTISFSYKIHQPPPRHTDLPPSASKPPPPPIYLSMEVVAEILAMLPAKALMKFRCVCKSWNSLIQDDSYFPAQHSNNSKKKPTFVSLSETRFHDNTLNCFPYNGSKVRKIDFSLDRIYSHGTNSCNGLVCVYDQDVSYVANPSIKKLAMLPRGSPHVGGDVLCSIPLAGIGYEPSTAVYKVVRLFVRKHDQYKPVNVGCEVFYLGGSSWKSIEDPPEPFIYMTEGYKFRDPCSVVDGAMYWTVPSHYTALRSQIALSFDLREENFGFLLHPKRSSRPIVSSLISIEGRLCIVDTLKDLNQMKIWTLKDRRSSEWVKQHTVNLSRICPTILEHMSPLTIDGRRIVLLCCNRKIYYDLMSMRIVHRTRTDHVDFELIYPYTESIIWPFCN